MNQPVMLGVYKSWTWIGIPLILASGFALWILISGLIALTKGSFMFRVPLRERQEIEFSEPGRVALNMEGKRFTTRFASLNFELYGLGGQRIPDRPSLMRKRTSGISDVRVELLTFEIPSPGRYVLVTTGLRQTGTEQGSEAVAFMRPNTAKTVAYIVGIVLSSCILIGSLVILILRLNRVGLSG
ncbi:MAG: hypothetical protein IH602_08365 [Bryobacteraceae bacterium]|nr:hypothetical protein [Bryobacteraceae bacterium]